MSKTLIDVRDRPIRAGRGFRRTSSPPRSRQAGMRYVYCRRWARRPRAARPTTNASGSGSGGSSTTSSPPPRPSTRCTRPPRSPRRAQLPDLLRGGPAHLPPLARRGHPRRAARVHGSPSGGSRRSRLTAGAVAPWRQAAASRCGARAECRGAACGVGGAADQRNQPVAGVFAVRVLRAIAPCGDDEDAVLADASRIAALHAPRLHRSDSEGEWRTSKRSCAALATLLTFCPPGPERE